MSFGGKAVALHPRHHSMITFGHLYRDETELTGVINRVVAERNLWTAPLQHGEPVFSLDEGREYSLPERARRQAAAIQAASSVINQQKGIIALHEQPNGHYVVVARYYDPKLGSREVRSQVQLPPPQKPFVPQELEHTYA